MKLAIPVSAGLLGVGGSLALAWAMTNHLASAPRASAIAAAKPSTTLAATLDPAPTASPTPDPTPTPTPSPAPLPAPLTGTVTFAMPVYYQTMNLDCETAALQMALAAIGRHYSQAVLFQGEPEDLRAPFLGPYVRGYRTVIKWGDPYVNFVGNVNGADLIPTGYGVYYPLVLAIARSHGAPNAIGGEGYAAATIYAAVAAGHPVIAWTETGWARPPVGTWTAWDNRSIRYSIIEHAVALSGVSPTQVRVNDPWKSGSQYWISKSTFEQSWADFNHMAVILQ